ncbi:MAG: hypothetical protein H6739_02580 [Alphaproteobacteria bacterium]|nr:hypothetical protein [Alphaproteobacteria bacterium]
MSGETAAAATRLQAAAGLLLLVACDLPSPPKPPPPAEVTLRLSSVEGDVEHYLDPDGGPPARYDRATRTLERDGEAVKARVRWGAMGAELGPCVGDPLALPPAGDTGGFRKLVWATPPRWRVELSGFNRCSLSGAFELDTRVDRVPVVELVVDGRPWREGGREHARAILRAEVRADALRAWPDMSKAERILLLKALSEDPEPAALDVLESLRVRQDVVTADVEDAIARWRARYSSDSLRSSP